MLAYQLGYNAAVIAGGLPFNTEAVEYLDKEFQGCITTSLEELLRERPEDPIPFLSRRIRENKKEELAEQLLRERENTPEYIKSASRRRRGSVTGSATGQSYTTIEKLPSEDEHEGEAKHTNITQTVEGYTVKLPGDFECQVNRARHMQAKHIPGINVAKMMCPSIYDIDATLRMLEASAAPNEKTGVPTPTILVVEQATAPEQVIFSKGIPYTFNLVEPLQNEIRRGNTEVQGPKENETFLDATLELLKQHLWDDISFLEDTVVDYVKKRNAEGGDIHLCMLPAVQSNYLETFDRIDEVFFEIMHPELTSCIRRGKHYSKTPSAQEIPFIEPPTVLFVSYSWGSANLTFSRVLQPFFPYYERLQNIKMEKLREMNIARKAEYNVHFCEKYWSQVHHRREERDKQHKSSIGKQARLLRREKEDTKFLEVMYKHKQYYATQIQRVVRGYLARKKLTALAPPPVSPHTIWDVPLPLAIPPLIRLCAMRISAVHGELFGNYSSSILPQPQQVVLHKPVRKPFRDENDDESETEDWVDEIILIPPKRFSRPPCHFNPIQRLMEYHRLANCCYMESAMKIQKQCGGMSLLQRRAYDYLKSVVLSLLHIAFLELFHRDRLPFDSMRFSAFVRNFHGEVCGWLSYPHLLSQSSLMSACVQLSSSSEEFPVENKLLQITEDFIETTLRKERLLLLRSNIDYVSAADAACFKAKTGIRKLGKNIFLIPRLLSEAETKAAIQMITDEVAALSPSESSTEDLMKIIWWFLPESPCILAYGRAFTFRQRKNEEVIEGRERYDEFCTHHVLKRNEDMVPAPLSFLRNTCTLDPTALEKTHTPSSTRMTPETLLESSEIALQMSVRQNFSCLTSIYNSFSMTDADENLKKIVLKELLSTGKLDYLKEHVESKTFERKTLFKPELDAEKLEQFRNQRRDKKPMRVIHSESDTESYISSHHSSEVGLHSDEEEVVDKTLEPRTISPLSAGASACGPFAGLFDFTEIRTMQDVVKDAVMSNPGVEIQAIRPRMNFAAQEEFITRFDVFVEACLNQIKDDVTIILNFDDDKHLFYCAVVSVLHRGYEAANIDSLGEAPGVVPAPNTASESVSVKPREEDMRRLAFLEDMYEILRDAMTQNGVDVNDCVESIHTMMSELENYNLLHMISLEIEKAECAVDYKECRQHILRAVRFIEHYVWLLLLQVYLSLPFTKDSLSKTAINPTPSFSSFYKSIPVRKWLESIDPWAKRPQKSPDVFHMRYSNSLRRWDADDYICFGSIVDQDIE